MGEKLELKKGAWSSEEDKLLLSAYSDTGGLCSWNELAKHAGLNRDGKSCRLRYVNYLHPDLKLEPFTREEKELILKYRDKHRYRWSDIAAKLIGRTDNAIKNCYNTHLKEKSSKRTKPKKAKSVPKPDNEPLPILESSSVAPPKHDMLAAYDTNVIPSKPHPECEQEYDILSVSSYLTLSSHEFDNSLPLTVDDYITEGMATGVLELSTEHGGNYLNDQFKIDEVVATSGHEAAMPEPNSEVDTNYWNDFLLD